MKSGVDSARLLQIQSEKRRAAKVLYLKQHDYRVQSAASEQDDVQKKLSTLKRLEISRKVP